MLLKYISSPKHALNEVLGWRLVLNLEQRTVLDLGNGSIFYGGLDLFLVCVYMHVCIYLCARVQNRCPLLASKSLQLELEVVVSHTVKVLNPLKEEQIIFTTKLA